MKIKNFLSTIFISALLLFPNQVNSANITINQKDIDKQQEYQKRVIITNKDTYKRRFLFFQENISTPEQAAALSTMIQYVSDKSQFHVSDYWQSPVETLRRKKGDCEDISAFIASLLIDNGYEPVTLTMSPCDKDEECTISKTGHSVYFFCENGKYRYVDDGKVSDRFNSLSELVSSFGNKFKSYNYTHLDKLGEDWLYYNGNLKIKSHALEHISSIDEVK